jgi:hypothetical protein
MFLLVASPSEPQCSSSGQRLLASWPCAAGLPILCGPEGNEQCLATIAECSALFSCGPPNHVRCADGTCTSSAANCIAAAAACGVGVLCADGSCGSTAAACTAVPGCHSFSPTRCADGSCTAVSSGCATLYPCAPAMERCADGQCALRHRCPPSDGCAFELPQLCADRRCYAAGADCVLGCAAAEDGSARLRCHDGTCAAAADCAAPPWASKPPRFSARLLAGGATSSVFDMVGVGSVTVPSAAFASEVMLTTARTPTLTPKLTPTLDLTLTRCGSPSRRLRTAWWHARRRRPRGRTGSALSSRPPWCSLRWQRLAESRPAWCPHALPEYARTPLCPPTHPSTNPPPVLIQACLHPSIYRPPICLPISVSPYQVPQLPLSLSLRATLLAGVAEADACLGELLELEP